MPIDERVRTLALKLFREMSEAWSLSESQRLQLLGVGNLADLNQDSLIRISHLIRIYKLLHTVFEDPHQANSWMQQPNRMLGGDTALTVVLCGIEGIVRVRNLLEIEAPNEAEALDQKQIDFLYRNAKCDSDATLQHRDLLEDARFLAEPNMDR